MTMWDTLFGAGRSAKSRMVAPEEALPGRAVRPFAIPSVHAVLGTPLEGPWPEGMKHLYVGLGCFWGAEKRFWRLDGVYTTAVGYQGGMTPNPTYEEVCTGRTGHAENVLVVYDPARLSTYDVLKVFWENHDPTQGMRQGNDIGTAYRSAIYWTTPGQEAAARATATAFQGELTAAGFGAITTELRPASEAGTFWYAEDYHQQYLDKNPGGYCNHGPNGLTCPVGVANLPAQQDIAPPG